MNKIDLLHKEMIAYDQADPKRIQHFTKVYAYASLIGKMEGLTGETQEILEAAALVHDIGIHPAEEKYGYQNGKLQEQEGPLEAGKLLEKLGFSKEMKDRICYLVGHHHTYTGIEGKDYQILVEADFIVNIFEDGDQNLHAADEPMKEMARNAMRQVFRTEAGKELLTEMFGL